MDRPNILLIMSDQHRGDCFGFEGRRVSTPHLDLLASQGARFSACITPNVVCMPARSAVLTGMLPMTNGVHDNGIDLDEALADKGFAGSLSKAGYDTRFIGKAHFSSNHSYGNKPTGRCENIPSSHLFADDWQGPYMGFENVELMQLGHNYWLPEKSPGGLHYERWYHADGQGDLKDKLYKQALAPLTNAAQTHNSALPTAWHNSTWVGDRAVSYLREQGRAQRSAPQNTQAPKPFCAWVSMADPHHPFDAPAPWCWMHRPEDVDLPAHRSRDLERRPWWHRAALENTPGGTPETRKVREEYSRMPLQTDAQLRDITANYYGMISLVDHQVGRILAALEEEGLAENTLVVFTSDHGELLGDHGLMLKGPMHYEGLLRVGLLMRGPGVAAGQKINTPVSTIDLAATFGDYASTRITSAIHSTSLRPLLENCQATPRDHAYNEWRLGPSRCGVALDLRTVRTQTAKLTVELGSGAGEMYDLNDDPYECINRFEDPNHRGLRDELMQRLMSRPNDIRTPSLEPVGPA
ncbi:sulfatase-like hydrolase/transferase [Variovorax sp. PCZ-1]|uniref:sulfatase-like hydrolase/transferase n=1 Tax=Variovorax sp. PCZ-1 TaxID=2835533 RepID=UPI001BCC4C7E|nr:sulfatase-like hydrolase/transferase [Variovorax sp. PCZ-1]MBS7807284.1 sulfatase-like hydrolase/transferase [Variovorax sp. PCZ-1]